MLGDELNQQELLEYIPRLLVKIKNKNLELSNIERPDYCYIVAILYLVYKLENNSLEALKQNLKKYEKLQPLFELIYKNRALLLTSAKNLTAAEFKDLFSNEEGTLQFIASQTVQWLRIPAANNDENARRSNMRDNSSDSLSSNSKLPATNISFERSKLISFLKKNKYSESSFLREETRENNSLKNHAIQTLISELKNPNKKISEIRAETRTLNKRFSSASFIAEYTIDKILTESQFQQQLNQVQEKEEGKLTPEGSERNSIESGSPSGDSFLDHANVQKYAVVILQADQKNQSNSAGTTASMSHPRREEIIQDMRLIVRKIYSLLMSMQSSCGEKTRETVLIALIALIENCTVFDYLREKLEDSGDSEEAILASLGEALQKDFESQDSPAKGLNMILQYAKDFVKKNKLTIYLACEKLKAQNITCVPEEGVSQATKDEVNPLLLSKNLVNHADVQAHIAPAKIVDDVEMSEWKSAAIKTIENVDIQIVWLNVVLFFHDFYYHLFGNENKYNAEGMVLRRKICILTEFKTKVENSLGKNEAPALAKTNLKTWALRRTPSGEGRLSMAANISVLERHRDKDKNKADANDENKTDTTSAAIVKDLILGPPGHKSR